jgi:hypothetical protein
VRQARDDDALAARQPLEEQVVRLLEARVERGARPAQHDEGGLRDAARLGLAEVRGESTREVDLEAGRRVGDRLLEGAGEDPVEVLGVARPAPAEELVDGDGGTGLPVPGDGLEQSPAVQVGALADHETGFEQGHRPDELGLVEREAQRDDAAEGVPDDVGAGNTQVGEQPAAVVGLLHERQRRASRVARAVAAAVVRDDPVGAGQEGLREQRPERVGDEPAVDADDDLAAAGLLVGQPDAVHDRAVHPSRPIVRPGGG